MSRGIGWKPMDRNVQIKMHGETWDKVKEVARPAGFRSANEFVRDAVETALDRVAGEREGIAA